MNYYLISFDIWKAFVKSYIKKYILQHNIYRWIPSKIPWDSSGTVEKVEDELLYIATLEQEWYEDDFLCTLYNGNCRASYESGCGFYYDTFHDDIIDELEIELFERLKNINEISSEDEEESDNLFDFITDIETEWIYDLLKEFSKEKVISILKVKNKLSKSK